MAIMATVGMIPSLDLSCVQPHNCLDNYWTDMAYAVVCQNGMVMVVLDRTVCQDMAIGPPHEECAKLAGL